MKRFALTVILTLSLASVVACSGSGGNAPRNTAAIPPKESRPDTIPEVDSPPIRSDVPANSEPVESQAPASKDASPSPRAETPTPPKKKVQKYEYVVMKEWSGNSIKDTETFTVDSKDWAIEWSARDTAVFAVGGFQLYVHDADGKLIGIAANSMKPEASDVSYQHNGPGTFYIKVNSVCDWTVRIQHQVPEEEAKRLKAAEEAAAKLSRNASRKSPKKKPVKSRPAPKPVNDPPDVAAAKKLKLAKSFIDKNDAVAKRRLQAIIDDFPDTDAAKEATDLLDNLN